MSSPVDEQETQVRPIHREQTPDSPSPQAQSDGTNLPPPSAQPVQESFDFEDYLHDVPEGVAADDNQQDSNATSCVEETQFVGLELDSQAPKDQISPVTQRLLDEGSGQTREILGPISQPVFGRKHGDKANQPKLIERPVAESIDDMSAGFKFGAVAKPKGGSYSRPPSCNPVEERPLQAISGGSTTPTEASHPTSEKVTEETRNSLPSRGGLPKSIVQVRADNTQVSPNITTPPVRQNVSKSPVREGFAQKTVSSKRSHSTSHKHNTPAAVVPRNDAPMLAYATPQSIPGLGVRALIPQAQNSTPQIPNPPTHNRHNDTTPTPNVKMSSKPAAPPFADVARGRTGYASAQNSPAIVQGREISNRRDLKENRDKHRKGHGNQPVPSHLSREQQELAANVEIRQNPQHEVNISYDRRPAQMTMWNEEHPRANEPRQTRLQAPMPEGIGQHDPYDDDSLPDTRIDELGSLNHQQVRPLPSNNMVNRPLPAAQLQPRFSPQPMTENSRGVRKVSRSKPKSRTPELPNRNNGQPNQLNAGTKPTSVDILQMVMFMAHNEQEQSQAAEMQIKDQQSKIEQLVNENFALQREVGSVQGEKHHLGIEFAKLREKSECYKTHINEVTRSQKHLEKLILKSNENREKLIKDVEEREDAARKQVEEAGIQIDSFRSALVERVEEGVKNARHQIELLEKSHQQLKKDLEDKALLLLREQGQRDKLEKKLEKCQPDPQTLLKKLQEHFENVGQQLREHEGKLSSIAGGEETTKSKFEECLTILTTIKNKETPEPLALGELVKVVETMSTRIEDRLISDGEAQSNLREEGRGLLDDLKDRIEAIQTDQKAQATLHDRISSLREANSGLTEKIKAIEVELSNLRNEHVSLKGEYDGCKGQLSATKEELSRVLALPREDPSLQSQIQELQTTNASLLGQVDKVSQELASAKEQLTLQQNKSKSDQEQADILREKLREADSLVGGFNAEKLKYEHAKTQESIKLRKELEKTLIEKLAEKTLEHENTELSLKRAKVTAEKKLSDALMDLEKSKASCLTAVSVTSQLRRDLETAESGKGKQAAEINRLEEGLDSITERYDSVSNELQSARDEISQCKRLVSESENQVGKSSETVQRARDEATQRLKDIEEYAETEIGKLKEQIIDLQNQLSKSEKLKAAFGRYLSSRGQMKEGQDLQQWANGLQPETEGARPTEPTPRSVRRVSFQGTPSVQDQISSTEQPSSSENMLQCVSSFQPPSSRPDRPRIAQRKSSIPHVVTPSHMDGLDNMRMQRTEVTEYSVRTSKTYESHRNGPQTPAPFTEISEMNRTHSTHSSSPMTDLEPVFADKKALETGQGMAKALKRQRSNKRSPQDEQTRVQHETRVPTKRAAPLSTLEEASRRREEHTPKSAMKRPRATSTPRNSHKKPASTGDSGETVMPSSVQRENQPIHSSKSPYNRVVIGSAASRQQDSTTGKSYKNSNLSRDLSVGVVTKSGENGDAHPAKMRRTVSKTVLPESQGESQISTYAPSQEL